MSWRGAFLLHCKTRVDRRRARLQEIKRTLRKRMHATIPQQGKWLKAVVHGLLRVSHCAHEHPGTQAVPVSRHASLAPDAAAPQSKGQNDVGTSERDRR